jgi:hypothetical protein
LAALRAALDGARRLDDPALILRSTLPLIAAAGDDALLAAGRAAAERVAAALPEPARSRFRAAEALAPLHALVRQR